MKDKRDMNTIEIGDAVTLNHGGISMTVTSIEKPFVVCSYYHNETGTIKSYKFHGLSLLVRGKRNRHR